MGIVDAIFEAVTKAIAKITESLVSGADSLLFVPGTLPEDPKTLTTLALVVFTFTGISIGFALVKWILGLVKVS